MNICIDLHTKITTIMEDYFRRNHRLLYLCTKFQLY